MTQNGGAHDARAHEAKAYVGVATSHSEDAEPKLEDAIHNAAELAAGERENLGKLFDVVRIQIVLSNPHIKEVRATITQSGTTS